MSGANLQRWPSTRKLSVGGEWEWVREQRGKEDVEGEKEMVMGSRGSTDILPILNPLFWVHLELCQSKN